ncbi:putative quinol monooxygenase [Paenibacillus campi]|uniref:putative quinol monooxygenase n=1 Tax=Paenibacillus campi TaxID=3106031 RepID=UPI002AFF4B83|nr:MULTISPECIES: putative quinol monooxygenase [unclassified Paenibacillus]
MLIIHANMLIKPEQVDKFLQEIDALVTASQAEEGNISYVLKRDVKQHNLFTMVEEWKDAEAMKLHNATPHFQKFVQDMQQFAAAPLDAKVFEATELKRG